MIDPQLVAWFCHIKKNILHKQDGKQAAEKDMLKSFRTSFVPNMTGNTSSQTISHTASLTTFAFGKEMMALKLSQPQLVLFWLRQYQLSYRRTLRSLRGVLMSQTAR